MPLTNEKIEAIRMACIAVNPEIVELKFGCVYRCKKKGYGHCLTIPMLTKDGPVKRNTEGEFVRDEYIKEIIGRPIRLADVLNINRYISDLNVLAIVRFWNLGNDNLLNQNIDTIDFIYDLIK